MRLPVEQLPLPGTGPGNEDRPQDGTRYALGGSLPPSLRTPGGIAVPQKSVVLSTRPGERIDRRIIRDRFYHAFNVRALIQGADRQGWTGGVTSPNDREGKTTVACNLAVTLSLGSGWRTLLVDLNTRRPRVHDIFGVSAHPGLLEALEGDEIHVSPTGIDRLSVLGAGNHRKTRLGMEDLLPFQAVLAALEREFPFIIVDMPTLGADGISAAFAGPLDGVVLVVDTQRTRRRDVDRAFRQLSEEQVSGFVYNQVRDVDF